MRMTAQHSIIYIHQYRRKFYFHPGNLLRYNLSMKAVQNIPQKLKKEKLFGIIHTQVVLRVL